MTNNLVKRLHASESVLNLMIWAICSLLGMRLFLQLTNNFSLGRGNWHIAHVLWGGLFMFLGSSVMLIFYSKLSRKVGAVLTGIGWGLFIDEIGKYITRDNNYWFRPAIILIYISFIILFFVYRILEKKRINSLQTLWYELLETLEEIADDDLEISEKKSLLRQINQLEKISSTSNSLILLSSLKKYVSTLHAKNDHQEFDLPRFLAKVLKTTYSRLFKKKIILYSLSIYSFWYIIDKFLDAIRVVLNPHRLATIQTYYSHYDFFSKVDVYMVTIKFVVEIIVAIFYLTGLIYWLKKKILRGIRFYQWGLLINIFIGSFFKFYFEQFSGVFGLILALIVWFWLESFRREYLLSVVRKS